MEAAKKEPIETEIAETKKRGFWLSAFLILMFIANPFTAFTYFSNPDVILQAYPALSKNLLFFMGVLAIFNFLFAIAIWLWKKAGVYGFYISVALAFFINLYIGLGIMGSVMGLIGGVIIFFTTKSRWKQFS